MFVCLTYINIVIVVALTNSQTSTQALGHYIYMHAHTHRDSGMGNEIGKSAMRTSVCQDKDRKITCQLLLEAKQTQLGEK